MVPGQTLVSNACRRILWLHHSPPITWWQSAYFLTSESRTTYYVRALDLERDFFSLSFNWGYFSVLITLTREAYWVSNLHYHASCHLPSWKKLHEGPQNKQHTSVSCLSRSAMIREKSVSITCLQTRATSYIGISNGFRPLGNAATPVKTPLAVHAGGVEHMIFHSCSV